MIKHVFYAVFALAALSGTALAQPVASIDPARVYNESAAGIDARAKLKSQSDAALADLEREAAPIRIQKTEFEGMFAGKSDGEIKAILDKDSNLRSRYTIFLTNSDLFIERRLAASEALTARANAAVAAVLDAAGPDVDAAKAAAGASQVVTSRPPPAGAIDITSDVIARFSRRVKTVPLPPPTPPPARLQ